MTVEEKRDKILKFCTERACSACPLDCENMTCDFSKPENIESSYLIIFGKENEPANDPVNPGYYNDSTIAPIDVIEDWDLDFCLGSALKYIKRAGKKANNPNVQDLRKVIWYVERRIKELEEARA